MSEDSRYADQIELDPSLDLPDPSDMNIINF